jgi:hypothetical protein
MAWVYVVISLALMQYFLFGMAVGRARGRFGIAAPATTGHPEFERVFRVQMNTLEQLIMLIPGMWIFGTYVNASWAAGLGVVFIIGRALYSAGYTKEPKKRGWGFAVSALPVMILLAGGLIGAAMSALGDKG